jgi:MYXO-CTERM domain-containing protein
MRTFACLLFVTGLAWALPGEARADVVRPPPRNCPDGAHGESGHAGPYCTPSPCVADGDCGGFGRGFVCVEISLCVNVVEYTDWSGQTYTRDEVVGVCGPGGSCTAPATCDTGKKCAPPQTSTSSSGAGTGASGASGPSGPSGAGGQQSGAGGGEAAGGSGSGDDKAVKGCSCGVAESGGAGAALALAATGLAAAAMRRGGRRRRTR